MDGIRRIASRLRSERGHTLVELSFAAMLLIVMLGTVLLVATLVQRSEPSISARAGGIQQARVLVERLDRELRVSRRVDFASSNRVVFETYLRRTGGVCGGAAPAEGDNSAAIPCEVEYICTAGTCNRAERAPVTGVGTGGTQQQVVRGLQSSSPFTCVPECATTAPVLSSIDWLGVSLQFPGENGQDAITLSGGTNLRNT